MDIKRIDRPAEFKMTLTTSREIADSRAKTVALLQDTSEFLHQFLIHSLEIGSNVANPSMNKIMAATAFLAQAAAEIEGPSRIAAPAQMGRA